MLARTLAETGTVGTAELDAFLGGVQRGAPLSELELAHFIPALKGALILRLARLCRSLPGRDEALAGELERLFTTLRTLGGADLAPVLERHSQAEQALRQDPAGAYAAMDDATRARYRDRLCALARKTGRSEAETARRLGVKCYDKELIALAAAHGELNHEKLTGFDEKQENPWLYEAVYEGNHHVPKGRSFSAVLYQLQSEV
ncbi:MAG: cytidylate kinase-like family protein, partial [Lawsonibacter sp.]|nr:cytidylate kinase-like family protein [Lawsonibacter sp.]